MPKRSTSFIAEHLNPYVNFHRPCAVAEMITEPNGKRRRVYRKWATPFEIFSQAPQCESCLRPGVSMAELESFAKGSPIPKLPSKCREPNGN